MPELLFLPPKWSEVLRLIALFSNQVPTASEVASNRLKQTRPEPTFFLQPGEINHRVKPNLEEINESMEKPRGRNNKGCWNGGSLGWIPSLPQREGNSLVY
ncbi:hypothetical protein COLO4_36909 [Corchorus olitorius]|uniref:Uncharacterized protein n=1 Tax=Corchorus olitorius TaxID=93759 RepID=A0A1R3G4D3_9ROSI|nr:hypothetical protein COLO4_36909 [Corchorus olitorius]